jgi:hypothetical protein
MGALNRGCRAAGGEVKAVIHRLLVKEHPADSKDDGKSVQDVVVVDGPNLSVCARV